MGYVICSDDLGRLGVGPSLAAEAVGVAMDNCTASGRVLKSAHTPHRGKAHMEEDLERLVVEQIPRLRRYAHALMGDATRAEDLVQDSLERAWSRIHRWRRDSDMRAWLFTIMHNLYVNQVRHSSSGPQFIAMDEEAIHPAVLPTQEAGLELRDLTTVLARLPPEQREVLLLVALEDMSYEQVSKILEIPIGTVMSRLHRARERLRAWMSGSPGLRAVK